MAVAEPISRPAPSPRIVFVVSRSHLDLYRQLARAFDGSDQVETILDRRAEARGEAAAPTEWTDAERRAAPADSQLASLGWTIAWQAPRPSYREILESLRDDAGPPRARGAPGPRRSKSREGGRRSRRDQ